MKNSLKVIIIDRSIQNINLIKNALCEEENIEVVDSCNNWFVGIKRAIDLKVNMIIVHEEIRGIRKNNVASIFKLNVPKAKVIIIAEDRQSKKLKECLSEGADSYILSTFTKEEVKEVIMRYSYEVENKNPQIEKDQACESTIISVFNTKGGVGRSTLVANLSIAIREKTKESVAIIDFNIGNSDIPIIMNVFPRKTLGEFRTESHRDLDNYLLQHESGVEILTFLKDNEEEMNLLFKEEVEGIIENIKTKFRYVLIDMPSYYDEVNKYSLEISDQILLVSTWDLSSIRNTIETIKVLNRHNISKEKINIILNRYENDYGLNIENIKKMTGKSELLFIPEDRRTATDSINSGKPFTLNRKKTQISKSIVNIANRVITKNSVASF